jgi:hypothetical protein
MKNAKKARKVFHKCCTKKRNDYLIKIVSTFENWTKSEKQGTEPSYKMKFRGTLSTSRVHCCLPTSPDKNFEAAIIMNFNCGRKGGGNRGHPDLNHCSQSC